MLMLTRSQPRFTLLLPVLGASLSVSLSRARGRERALSLRPYCAAYLARRHIFAAPAPARGAALAHALSAGACDGRGRRGATAAAGGEGLGCAKDAVVFEGSGAGPEKGAHGAAGAQGGGGYEGPFRAASIEGTYSKKSALYWL